MPYEVAIMSISMKRICSLLSVTLGVLLGILTSQKTTKLALADLTCSDLTTCLGGNHCGGPGTVSTCTLECTQGGSVVCPPK
jgi:hypothetical protein